MPTMRHSKGIYDGAVNTRRTRGENPLYYRGNLREENDLLVEEEDEEMDLLIEDDVLTGNELHDIPLPVGPPLSEMGWMSDAACLGSGVDFQPPKMTPKKAAACKEVCASCPVQMTCRLHALKWNEIGGVWGGLTGAERDALLESPLNGPERPE